MSRDNVPYRCTRGLVLGRVLVDPGCNSSAEPNPVALQQIMLGRLVTGTKDFSKCIPEHRKEFDVSVEAFGALPLRWRDPSNIVCECSHIMPSLAFGSARGLPEDLAAIAYNRTRRSP